MRLFLASSMLLAAACGDESLLEVVPPPGAGEPGGIAFASATLPGVVKPAGAASVDVPVTLVRSPSWATAGAISTRLSVTSGPCTPVEQIVGFADGVSTPVRVIVRATDIGTCVLRLTGGDVATDPTDVTTATVQIVPELSGVRGAIAFASASNPDIFLAAGVAAVDVPITIVRTPLGATVGAISTHLRVTSGPCAPAEQVVGFADGESGAKVITLQAAAGGTCGIGLILDDADTSAGAITSTFVTIIDEEPATLRGVIAFPSATPPDVVWGSRYTPMVTVPVTLVRTPAGAQSGALTTQLRVTSGPCAPADQTVGFADGASGSQLVLTVTATSVGDCRFELVGGDAGAITSAVVRILSAPDPSVPCVNSAGQLVPYPSNSRVQQLLPGGTNNYAVDEPEGQMIIFPLVMNDPENTGPNGEVIWPYSDHMEFAFATTAAQVGPYFIHSQWARFEVAFSKCPGDFDYYQSEAAAEYYPGSSQVFRPCGYLGGANGVLSWTHEHSIYSCYIPEGEQWYMSWRVVGGCGYELGYSCGQTFGMPGW
jgi:hypothetical protein